MEKGELEDARQAVSYYESLSLAKESLHYQYLCKMKAVIRTLQGEEGQILELLEEALRATLRWWCKDNTGNGEEFSFDNIITKYSVGKEEISLLLMWLQQMWKEGKNISINGRKLLSILSDYYETDLEERSNLFSKVCWVLGSYHLEREEKKEAYFYTKEGERVLAECRILLYLPQYLDRLVSLEEELKAGNGEKWRKQRDALKDVLLAYGIKWETGDILLWKNLKIQEFFLISEIAEKERKVRNKSQQEIAFALDVDPKTISRLEQGIYKPKTETLQKVRLYYEIIRDVCNSRIVTEDFELLEMESRISVLHSMYKYEEAEKVYLNMKKKLDSRWKENRQYILYHDILYDHQLGGISHEEALERCKEAFHVTRPYLEEEMIDHIILSRTECCIINYMGICYRKMGKREKTISLLEKATRGYKSSKIDSRHYFMSLGLLYLNLVDNYEENNQFEEALLLCEEAIHYEIDSNKYGDLGYLLSAKQYILDRKYDTVREEGKYYYKQSFELMRLAKRTSVIRSLKKYYHKQYGEELE